MAPAQAAQKNQTGDKKMTKKKTSPRKKTIVGKLPKQRIGVIVMATAMVEASWKSLMEVLGLRFFPFAIHVSPDGTKRAYVGFCDDFDEVGADEQPPRYLVNVETDPRGGRKVAFTKYVKDEPEITPKQEK